jgi:hypothetical protein
LGIDLRDINGGADFVGRLRVHVPGTCLDGETMTHSHILLMGSAAVMGTVLCVYLILWYGLMLLVKKPENHQRLWKASVKGREQLAAAIASDERAPVWLIRAALISRAAAIVLVIASAAVLIIGLGIERLR